MTNPTPPTPVVTFSYANWSAAYPQFAPTVTAPVALGYFNRAALIFANSARNPAYRDGNMETLLYLLTAHIAALSADQADGGRGGLVGRIASASQGSVSVSAEWNGSGSPSEAWYIQTTYGAEFWQATAQYRNARYVARPTVVPGAGLPQYRYGYGPRFW